MRTLILRTAAPYLTSLMLLFSIFVLLRGHNEPGGGFIGGLIAVSAFAIQGIACRRAGGAARACASTRWRSAASACSWRRWLGRGVDRFRRVRS